MLQGLYDFIKGIFAPLGDSMIGSLVPVGSSFAGDIDSLIALVAVFVGFWGLLAYIMFFFLIFRYRRKEGTRAQYVTGEEKNLKRWISWPHAAIIVCDLVIVFMAVMVWYNIKQRLPEADATVRIVAQQWAWNFVHPGPDGVLDTDDDIDTFNELHVQEGLTYQYELVSKDVLHDFSVPVWRLKQDAIPGRIMKGWFKPTMTGTFDIQCAEMCGIGHGIMGARVVIETPEEHAAWVSSGGTTLASATGR
ncbi:MAG: cytochrome C oxidase subunit II [Myxococcota bacterium]